MVIIFLDLWRQEVDVCNGVIFWTKQSSYINGFTSDLTMCGKSSQTKSQHELRRGPWSPTNCWEAISKCGYWGRERVSFLQGGGPRMVTHAPVVYMPLGGEGRWVWPKHVKTSKNNVKREVQKFFLLQLFIKGDSELVKYVELFSDLLYLLSIPLSAFATASGTMWAFTQIWKLPLKLEINCSLFLKLYCMSEH